MSGIKAVFKKQLKDTYKNMAILIQFLLFPAVAFITTELIAKTDDTMPNSMFATMMASIFAGMGLIPLVASIIAEDRERKSLRFLVMAGVKPSAYLLGIGTVILLASVLPAIAFSLIADFRGHDFWIFTAVIMSGVSASILIGAIIGIVSENQQAATGLSMPVAMIFGFGPMIAQFNEQAAQIFRFLYSQQFNIVANGLGFAGGYDSGTNLWQSFGIMWANVAIMVVLFVYFYVKKGLRG